MRIAVCAKEVFDPDAVNSYALAGRLVIADDGKTLVQAAIPRLMNAYDEQAIEAALRLRDAGAECTIAVVAVGADPSRVLAHAASLGVDQIVAIAVPEGTLDGHAVAVLLAAWVRSSGGADLVLCGRQASDDDQGVVPALLGERLGIPVVTIARAVELVSSSGAPEVRITRVTPDGDEVIEGPLPVVVTVSNELGQPRYPTVAGKMAARRRRPTVIPPEALSVDPADLRPRVKLVRQLVPQVQGHCEMISGETPAEAAEQLAERLRADGLLA